MPKDSNWRFSRTSPATSTTTWRSTALLSQRLPRLVGDASTRTRPLHRVRAIRLMSCVTVSNTESQRKLSDQLGKWKREESQSRVGELASECSSTETRNLHSPCPPTLYFPRCTMSSCPRPHLIVSPPLSC